MNPIEYDVIRHLVDLSPSCKLINYKWYLKKKLKLNRKIDKYKALLRAKGFRQRENIVFFNTFFFPVNRITL